MKSILDPSFKYTSSAHTDLRKTFARVRRERAAAEKAATETPSELCDLVDFQLRAARQQRKEK